MGNIKTIVLLSGGLDSLVSFAMANKLTTIKLALTFDYGQKSAKEEIKSAKLISKFYKVSHEMINLPWLKAITNTALVSPKRNIPNLTARQLDNKIITKKTANLVWVPNRNGVFLNIAAAYAEALNCQQIITGFNKEEGVSFPDNSIFFVQSINKTFSFSTLKKIKLKSYTLNFDKCEIVKMGIKLKVPFNYLYSCYKEGPKMCGVCESCQRLKRAFSKKWLL